MRTKRVIDLLTNKTSINVTEYWAVYDGSMWIDNDGTQSYIQNWESFEGFGFSYHNGKGYHTDFVTRDDITELEYEKLLELLKK